MPITVTLSERAPTLEIVNLQVAHLAKDAISQPELALPYSHALEHNLQVHQFVLDTVVVLLKILVIVTVVTPVPTVKMLSVSAFHQATQQFAAEKVLVLLLVLASVTPVTVV